VSLFNEWHNDERTIVLLLESAFEHVAALGRTSARDLNARIGSLWPHSNQTGMILWAINSCLFSNDMMRRVPADADDLQRTIFTGGSYRRGTSLILAYRELERLAAITTSPLHESVVRRVIGQLGDPETYRQETDRLVRQADLMASRQRRVRNALTHGNPVTRHVLSSVISLTEFRTRVALQAGLDSFSEGVALEDFLRDKEANRKVDDELRQAGKSMIEIWEEYGPEG
jgi:hypothetical protein